MKNIRYLVLFAFIASCKTNYTIQKTNIELNSYTNSKYKKGLIVSGFDSDLDFYSLYYTEIKRKSTLGKLTKIEIEDRSDFLHISNGTHLPISNEFYFTSNNLKTGNLELYKSYIKDLKLINPKIVRLNPEKGSYGHSTFMSNGLSMIIASKDSLQTKLKLYTRQKISSNWELKRDLKELNLGDINFHPTLINDSLIVYSQKVKNKIDLYSSNLSKLGVWSTPKKIKGLTNSKEKLGYIQVSAKSGYFTSKDNEKDIIYYFELKN